MMPFPFYTFFEILLARMGDENRLRICVSEGEAITGNDVFFT